ncbi:MAG TPA: succinyldiaminopimelate transaminase [Casimicrobiaceae bacterium]|nr:succinyldiaminopimelate transaminase [Casimicrobiaceae bacterium]
MNPQLARLQPYPFERLRALFAGVTPNAARRPINLSLGEPKHPTPPLILEALAAGAKGLANYPTTAGSPALREAIAAWLVRRHALSELDPATQVLPVLGSREALFAFAQTVIDASRVGATVVVPNPFYQIYEGAALLAGATPYCVNSLAENSYAPRWDEVPVTVWARTQLLYVCSPDNPTGRVMSMRDWQTLFELSDRHDFIIAADECYSEVYFDEANPPLGSLAAAHALGRDGYPRLLSFGSLSKRSNAPGMRSGYVAGDAALIKAFLLYRTYHGSAMSPAVAVASIAAWNDETHVRANRVKYAEKFARLAPRVAAAYPAAQPDAAFYLWARVAHDDAEFARRLYAEEAVTVLPGSYLAREADGINPGRGYVRIALVAELDECIEAVDRLVRFARGG